MSEAEARALERERLRPFPGPLHGDDDRLLDALLGNVRRALGPKGYQAIRRKVRQLRKEYSGNAVPISVTSLLTALIDAAAADKGIV